MHGSHPRRNAELTTGRHFYCYRRPSSASSMAQETNRLGSEMAKKGKDPAPDFIRVQHAVVIQKGKDLRALNDLLTVGWRAISTASMGSGVLIILEKYGTETTIEEIGRASFWERVCA